MNAKTKDFMGVHIKYKDFKELDLDHSNFSWSVLNAVSFENANLRYSQLISTWAEGVNFHRADLNYADLHDGNFKESCFTQASLVRASLRKANLQGADFTFADLRGADLRGAYLQDARLDGARLYGVIGLYAFGPIGNSIAYAVNWSDWEKNTVRFFIDGFGTDEKGAILIVRERYGKNSAPYETQIKQVSEIVRIQGV